MNAVSDKTSQQTTNQSGHPPGGINTATSSTAPKKIFVCSPYRPTSETEACRKCELESNIKRAKTACRFLSTLGFLPLAPHLYFTQFLKDRRAHERDTGIKLGLRWLEEADEVWVFGNKISEGMAVEIKKAHELNKPVRNLPEPERAIELLVKHIQERQNIPMEKNENSNEQQEAAESEENNG